MTTFTADLNFISGDAHQIARRLADADIDVLWHHQHGPRAAVRTSRPTPALNDLIAACRAASPGEAFVMWDFAFGDVYFITAKTFEPAPRPLRRSFIFCD